MTETQPSSPLDPGVSVSLLGTGPMGAPIARNIIDGGVPLTLWNRTVSKAEAIDGGTVAPRPADAAADVVLTVLPDLPQVEALLEGDDGLLAGWARAGVSEPVLVIHGTVSPTAVAAFAARCKSRYGVVVVDAPLSGGTIGAEQGRLSIMAGGPQGVVQRLTPLFGLYSSTIMWFGEAGAGAVVKACNQIVVAATVTALSESMALAKASGLDLEKVQAVLKGGLANSEVLQQKGGRWITGDFDGGGSAKNQLKDLRFVTDAAADAGLALPVANTLKSAFETMVTEGLGDLDHTGIYLSITSNRAKEPS
ncbi:3-hydroxyisobutyrate dehydrogenase-like beta-hydroxyacid dehydrogenase [Arthrobacter sp. B2I5]|uniref:NAD(P)-dependent oxidoreductase n=1 Tax=Arthrobacter sp. B2I5 TaxID=3042266 RepID=UPI0027825F26|nr:NAD(P)-dependent oxidoreductase [Arthrobacter sp. B2I5]MDQ0823856.1 3-hydroxyisobutyrate dehydrogenase-like beta-hydroxyacid dehydrogenase [Arthrobacter sp. B2I5]